MPTPDDGVVSSTRNPRVVAAASLHRRRRRDETARYLLEGPRAVRDLVAAAPGVLAEIFATPEAVTQLAAPAAAAGVRVTVVTEAVLERIADSRSPQGIVAVAHQRPAELPEVVGHGHLLVLVGVSDPGNLGTVIRTAAASGAAGVVTTEGSVDPWNPKAVRASAGAVARLPIVQGVPIEALLAALRRADQRIVALEAGGEHSVEDPAVLDPPVALLLGNEAHGLPSHVGEAADRVAAVPQYGPVESLNLAAAAAVAAYAAARAARTSDREGAG